MIYEVGYSSVVYLSEPDRFVVTYNEMHDQVNGHQTFQMILNRDGSIVYQYVLGSTSPINVFVGLENLDGTERTTYGTTVPPRYTAIKLTPQGTFGGSGVRGGIAGFDLYV